MPRNGSGTYSLPAGNPVVSGTTIQSTWANSTLNDVGDALTGSVARDGTGGMSGPLRLADGTISIPGIAFSSETTTGFSRPTTNAIVASVSAVERMRINASGVSVSGALSATSIDINGNVTLSGGTANGVVYLNGSKVATSGSALTFDGTTLVQTVGDGNVSSRWIAASGRMRLRPYVDATIGALLETINTAESARIPFTLAGSTFKVVADTTQTFSTANVDRMTLDASGNVGIGTASPTFSAGTGVHIYRSSGATLRVQDASTDFDILSFGGNANLLNRSNGALTLGTNNTERMRIAANGAIGIGGANYGTSGQVLTSAGSGAAPSWSALPSASTTAQGIIEIATDAEAQTGTDTSRAITAANLAAAKIQLGTAVASTSGTSIDFTGIPSWAKRVTVMFRGVSLNGTASPLVQLGGSGGFVTSGYTGVCSLFIGTGANTFLSSGFPLYDNAPTAASEWFGLMTICLQTGNTWIGSSNAQCNGRFATSFTNGFVSLSGVLDRVRITTAGGTDTFDAGTINVSWE